MTSTVFALRVAAAFFTLFCLGQGARFFGHVTVLVGGYTLPLWISFVAMVIGASLATWMWIASRTAGRTARGNSR